MTGLRGTREDVAFGNELLGADRLDLAAYAELLHVELLEERVPILVLEDDAHRATHRHAEVRDAMLREGMDHARCAGEEHVRPLDHGQVALTTLRVAEEEHLRVGVERGARSRRLADHGGAHLAFELTRVHDRVVLRTRRDEGEVEALALVRAGGGCDDLAAELREDAAHLPIGDRVGVADDDVHAVVVDEPQEGVALDMRERQRVGAGTVHVLVHDAGVGHEIEEELAAVLDDPDRIGQDSQPTGVVRETVEDGSDDRTRVALQVASHVRDHSIHLIHELSTRSALRTLE